MALERRDTVTAWPHLILREIAVFVWLTAAFVVLAILVDAPLRAPANADIPENPAKAPWYFLGLQELVSFSAFMGGLFLPMLAMVGLAFIPYLDREEEGVGVWLGARHDRVTLVSSLVFATVTTIAMLVLTVQVGWLREWFPGISQLVIILVNPGTVLTGLYVGWSWLVFRRTGSMRAAAVAIFTTFIIGFIILTVMGTFLRGPNWVFYWSPADWPAP